MRDAFIQELTALAEEDPSIFLVVGDLGFSVIEDFQARFPDRFLNAGVAEQTMIGVASGLAASGYKVYVYSIANFPTARCLEQIRNDVCYHDRDVTVVSVGSGVSYGSLGYTHHALEDIAFLRALPGMRVFSPADPTEARVLTRLTATHPGPTYLRLGKNGEPVLHDDVDGTLAGWSTIVDGDDVVVLSTGAITAAAVAAARLLVDRGLSAQVVSVPIIKPLDAVLPLLSGDRPVVTIEEHSVVGGFGSAVLELAAAAERTVPIRVLGFTETRHGIGSQTFLRERAGLSAVGIADQVETFVARVTARSVSGATA